MSIAKASPETPVLPFAGTPPDSRPSRRLPVDAHVHLHRGHRMATVFGSAVEHFRLTGCVPDPGDRPCGALLLTEVGGMDAFDDLHSGRPAMGVDGEWSVEPTEEPISLVVHRQPGQRLILVRGRQLVTAENLEILALFSSVTPPDGLPLRQAIDLVRSSNALAVVPWGFGKWWSARGRLVRDLLREEDPHTVFLGDTGCRPRAAPEPSLFAFARRRGFRILRGSDPLPLAGHQRRAGSYGFLADAVPDPRAPGQSLKAAIEQPEAELRPYGRRRDFAAFFKDQISMQRLKWKARG